MGRPLTPLRVACVGAGYFSQFHFDAWERIEQTEIVGIAERDPDRLAAIPHPHFADLGTMIKETAPDILDIITPPQTHLAFIELACAAGVKTIICQKAFCRNLSEARKAQALASKAGARLIVHENFRFQPWYRVMKKAVDDGLIGRIHQLTFRMRTGDGLGTDAYLARQPYFQKMERFLIHETGVHWLDTFRYLLGEPTHLYCDLRRMNPCISGEDAGILIMDFQGGARAVLDANRCIDHASDNHRLTFGECWLEGEKGTLSLNGRGEVRHRRTGSKDTTLLLQASDWPGFAGDCVFALQSHVVDHILSGTPLENSVSDYIPVMELEMMAYQSAEDGRKFKV